MQMPDANQYIGGGPGGGGGGGGGGGWYGNDGYGVAAAMGAGAGAAGIGAGAAAARGYSNHQQPSERDYRSETGSQGGESSAYGGYGHSTPQSQPPLTPAALAKQREAAGRQGYQSHSSRTSHGSGMMGGPSGSGGAAMLPSTSEGYNDGPGSGETSPGVGDRRSSAAFSDGRSVYQHADMPGQDAEVTEIPPK